MSQGSARRALSVGAALLALLAVVALASRGHVAGAGGGATRHINAGPVAEYFLLVFGLLALVLMSVIAIGFVKAKEDPSILRKRGNWMVRLVLTVLVLVVPMTALMIYRSHRNTSRIGAGGSPVKIFPGAKRQQQASPATRVASFDWVPVIVVFSIAGAGAAVGIAYFLRERRKRKPLEVQAVAALGEALDESLEDLRSERDARRAVIAAYARMERALAASGLPRRAAEAPLEYMTRVLRDLLRASGASVSRLTALFERAKFSTHEIGPDLKEEAIDALVAVREELRAYS